MEGEMAAFHHEAHENKQTVLLDHHLHLHSPPFAPTTPAPFFEPDQQTSILDTLQLGCHHELPLPDQIRQPTSPAKSIDQHPPILSTFQAPKSDRPSLQPLIVSPFLPSSSGSSFNNTISGSNSSSTSSVYSSARTIKPPPISIIPSLRRSSTQAQPSISTILNQDPDSNVAGRRLELEERSDWDSRTGRSEALAMRLNKDSHGLSLLRDGGRDRWGNRWGIENHVLSPVISERTEPTHTSVSSPISTGSIATNFSLATTCPSQQEEQQQRSSSRMPGCSPPTAHPHSLHGIHSISPSDQTTTSHSITSTRSQQSPTHHMHPSGSLSKADPHPHPSSMENHSAHTHHQHAISLLKRKKIKTHLANRQRDLDVANRQINKRIEKERRDQMIRARDEIVAKLMDDPNDAKLVRDLGKLYLRFNEPDQSDKQSTSSRMIRSGKAAPRSESSLKLAIHYLEQSIQIDNRDPLSWLFLGRAWSLLLAYPTEHENEREQRLLNSSLAFRKAIHISSNPANPSLQSSRQTNRFRLAYAEHLESLHKYKEAASVLQDGLGTDGTDVECWWELGRIMELWALDEGESQPTATKQERVERMRCACEAYEKATELEPDDSTIRQSRLDGEKSLQTLKAESQAEEESQAKSHKAEEDIRLTAARVRGLNLSPVTDKARQTTVAKPQQITNKSSVLALRKLVSELREIPEFGKKAPPSADPTPVQPVVEARKQSTEELPVKSDNLICTTQVESVISSSPAPSATGANRTRPPTGENLGSPLSRASPLPHVIHETSDAPELPPMSPMLQPPEDPARYSSQIASPEDLSRSSTQSQSDVRMMLMNLRTGSVEPPLGFDHSDQQRSPTRVTRNEPHLYSYQPPSPSALPTSMMQSLSARLGTPKAHLISSPKSSASSNSRSCSNGSQKAGEWRQRKSTDPAELGLAVHQQSSTIPHSPAPPCQSPTHDRPCSLKTQLTEIFKGHSGTLCESDAAQPSQQQHGFTAPTDNRAHHLQSRGDHNFARDQPDHRQPNGHRRSEDPDRLHSHSPSSYHVPMPDHHSANHLHHHPTQPHASLLKRPTVGPGLGLLSPLSKEVPIHHQPPGSPPPPRIPPRPASLCSHTRPPDGRNNQDNGHYQNALGSSSHHAHISRLNPAGLSPRPPAPLSTVPGYQHSPPTSPANTQLVPAYNYSLIDAHLQSILDIDLKRKEELKEIKKQIRKADEWAESRRRSVIEELRRVCTPVNGPSTVHHSDHQGSGSHSRSISRGRQPCEMENIEPVNVDRARPAGYGIHAGHQNRNTNPSEPMGPKAYKGALRTDHPKRSASTPPESNHHQQQQQQSTNAQARRQGLLYSDPRLPGEHLREAVSKERVLYSASVRPDVRHHHPLSPPSRPASQLKPKTPPLHQPSINQALVTELDKLGPAGFAINGITSIIQLLHQHQSHQIRQP